MQRRSMLLSRSAGSDPGADGRLEVRGKFFFSGADKVLLKGVTYGPFAPDANGVQYPEPDRLRQDLDLMVDLGANTLRTFTLPSTRLLDEAAARGLRVLAGLPWAQHVCFLDSKAIRAGIRQTVRQSVLAGREHPGLAAWLVGNEIPPDIVRYYGAPRVAAFLRELRDIVREVDPGALVGYATFPPTEYLETDFLDFFAVNVYLHREEDFRRYLSRLHAIAGDRPLVLTEFGMDSIREGLVEQAAALSWQVRTALQMGAAGTFVFSFTDEWYTGGEDVKDWAFGLVDRDRAKKPAFSAVRRWYADDGLPALPEYPKVSVVVCAYNAEPTMDACLASLQALRYPAFEIVVVNDGSTDRTGEIADSYEGVHVVHQENKGLSAARNVGIAASTGEIVAYTDSDCVADPDWLYYLVSTMLAGEWSAVGGPNLPPPEDSLVAACVAASPGGPLHVLLSDGEAEHVPGCNMAFRRQALEDIEGFDAIYRAAGDDVDLCWRLEEHGHRIGFSPAAVVWHFRRNTVRAYIGQQKGYGKAEALLYFRHPHRFNALGYSQWRGRIYGGITGLLSLRRPVVYGGVFGRGLFQTLYQPPASAWSALPLTLEWNVAALVLALLAVARGGAAWLGALPLFTSWAVCLVAAFGARVDPRCDNLRGRLLIAFLTYWGPLLRCFERYRWWARGLAAAEMPAAARVASPPVSWRARAFTESFWSEQGHEKETILHELPAVVAARRYFVRVDQGWSDWDVEVHGGMWSRAHITVATEYHGGPRRAFRVRCALRGSLPARALLGGSAAVALLGLTAASPLLVAAGTAVAAFAATMVVIDALKLARMLHVSLHAVARRAALGHAPPLRACSPVQR